jgi:hypothetical protein
MSALAAQVPLDEQTAHVASVGRSVEHKKTSAASVRDGASDDKRYSNARAPAALNGIALHMVIGGDGEPTYIACKWNLSRELRTLGEVESWLDQVTGHDPGRRERERRGTIDEANREQDRRDEAVDLLRGPGGEH